MRHGRNKQERETKLSLTRANNTPEHDSFEAGLFNESGRKRGQPPRGLVGAHTARVSKSLRAIGKEVELDDSEPIGAGSAVAPTRRAERREAERHQRERSIGHFAAGLGERKRASKRGKVTREALQRAGKAADEAVRKPAKRGAKAEKKSGPQATAKAGKSAGKTPSKPTRGQPAGRGRSATQNKRKTGAGKSQSGAGKSRARAR